MQNGFEKQHPFIYFLYKQIHRKVIHTIKGLGIQYHENIRKCSPFWPPHPMGPPKCLDLSNSRGAPWTWQCQGTKEGRLLESQEELCAKRWQPREVRSFSDISPYFLLPNLLSKADNVEVLHFSNHSTQRNGALISKTWERSSGWWRILMALKGQLEEKK